MNVVVPTYSFAYRACREGSRKHHGNVEDWFWGAFSVVLLVWLFLTYGVEGNTKIESCRRTTRTHRENGQAFDIMCVCICALVSAEDWNYGDDVLTGIFMAKNNKSVASVSWNRQQ